MKNLVKNIGEVCIPLALALTGCDDYYRGYSPRYIPQSFGNSGYNRDYGYYGRSRTARRERVIIIEREKRHFPRFNNAPRYVSPRYYNAPRYVSPRVDNQRARNEGFIRVRPHNRQHGH